MIKATIQNSPYCTEITFPCTEAELLIKLGELGINTEHLAPVGTVISIEPTELSMLEDCEVSLDALNYLGKRLESFVVSELDSFLAVLSCDALDIEWDLKKIVNLTFNLECYTLIENTSNLEDVGLTHMLNIRGAIPNSELKNRDWLAEEGRKLLDSGRGINTEYGLLFVNEENEFRDIFNGTTFPVYLYSSETLVSVEITYGENTELVELPDEDIAIKKALCRLGADSINDCKVSVDSTWEISDEWWEKIKAVENSKDIFGLNSLLKTEDILLKREQPVSIFNKEVTRKLRDEGYNVANEEDWLTVTLNGEAVVKISDKDILYTDGNFFDKDKSEFSPLSQTVREIYEYCSAYEKAAPLVADSLSKKYRCLAEFNSTVLAAKYSEEYGFEFVTWERTFDGKAVWHGNYYNDYAAAKENFAERSGLIDNNRLFGNEELEHIRNCVEFTMKHNNDLSFEECEYLKKLNERISESVPEQLQNEAPKMSM